jgi:hypothetical protein
VARKRMISPEIWRDSKVLQLSNDAFIVFIGAISCADDEGIIEPDSQSFFFELARKRLTKENIEKSFQELFDQKILIPYGKYAFFPSWYKHQYIEKPYYTKHQRPPKNIIEECPRYIEGWGKTFGKKNEPEKYPFYSCFSVGNGRGIVGECSGNVPLPFPPNGKEKKGKEEKGKEKKGINLLSASADQKEEIENSLHVKIRDSFISVYGNFDNFGKEGKAINQLIEKARARSPDDPESFIKNVMEKFHSLKTSGNEFWRKKPFLPSILNSSGIWPLILEEMKEKQIVDPDEFDNCDGYTDTEEEEKSYDEEEMPF